MYFSVYTLGCKLNQLETEALADAFCRSGFTLIPWASPGPGSAEPAFMLINTCTVTSTADQKARRLIRKALRDYPRACLFVTGCYAQMEEAALAALEEEIVPAFGAGAKPRRLFVIPGEKKDRLLDLPAFLAAAGFLSESGSPSLFKGEGSGLRELLEAWFALPGTAGKTVPPLTKSPSPLPLAESSESESPSFRFRPVNFSAHSRAFLKIQDGCDSRCAYCRVSLARGKSRSLGAAEVLAELRSLEKRGIAEAVLTGVNIVQYLDSGMRLPGLLDFLLKGTETIRLRLSSIEPEGLTEGFLRVLENTRIRPHFHLSVQSGSPEILSMMGRPYGPEDVGKASALLRKVREDPFLAADIIAGFPGETADEFEKTFSLCEQIGFAWIHAFPFSPRPGTAAYSMGGRVNERDAARRVERLTFLARKGRADYIRRWEGKEVEAVAESGKKRGAVSAVSENYLKLYALRGGSPAPGTLLRCRILPNPVSGGGDKAPKLPPGIDAPAEIITPSGLFVQKPEK